MDEVRNKKKHRIGLDTCKQLEKRLELNVVFCEC